jgi:hypothetical protein
MRRETLAAPQGFEPRYSAPEADVLPLNEGATLPLSNEFRSGSNRVTESPPYRCPYKMQEHEKR